MWNLTVIAAIKPKEKQKQLLISNLAWPKRMFIWLHDVPLSNTTFYMKSKPKVFTPKKKKKKLT